MVALVSICGCTQFMPTSAKVTSTTIPVPTKEATAVQPTPIETTILPTTVSTTAAPTVATTVPIVANVTVPTATTGIPTPVATKAWTASQTTAIHFTSAGFSPATDVVLPGAGVTWINDDTVTLTVMSTGNSTGMFNSGDIVPGGRYIYTFCLGDRCTGEGTFTYALKSLPAVNGTIIVQAGPTLSISS